MVDHKTLYKRAAEILAELDMHISPKTPAATCRWASSR